jgi:hypothetical protein
MPNILAMCLIFCLWQGKVNQQVSKPQETEKSVGQNQKAAGPPTTPADRGGIAEQSVLKSNDTQRETTPKWNDPRWVIAGITLLYTLFSGLTLLAIFRQNRSIQRTDGPFWFPTGTTLFISILIPLPENCHIVPSGIFRTSGKRPDLSGS